MRKPCSLCTCSLQDLKCVVLPCLTSPVEWPSFPHSPSLREGSHARTTGRKRWTELGTRCCSESRAPLMALGSDDRKSPSAKGRAHAEDGHGEGHFGSVSKLGVAVRLLFYVCHPCLPSVATDRIGSVDVAMTSDVAITLVTARSLLCLCMAQHLVSCG